jgi:hypothetical protein
MALQSSGEISIANIVREFGTPSIENISLGSYRIRQQLNSIDTNVAIGGTFYPLADGIPLPGQSIKISDFYGKKKTIVIEYNSSFSSTSGRSLNSDFTNRGSIGNFRVFQISPSPNAFPTNASTSDVGDAKIVVCVAGILRSRNVSNQSCCALHIDTNFNGSNPIILETGPSSRIAGSGGNGGAGGGVNANGSAGGNGGSAIGISVSNVQIRHRGNIQLGAGGGGGGGGGAFQPAGGGGGGGGAGDPAGGGGNRGTTSAGFGAGGNINSGGGGGGGATGRSFFSSSTGGSGGAGGSVFPTVTNSGGGGNSTVTNRSFFGTSRPTFHRSGGSAGANGFRLVIAPDVTGTNLIPITYNLVAPRTIGGDTTASPFV